MLLLLVAVHVVVVFVVVVVVVIVYTEATVTDDDVVVVRSVLRRSSVIMFEWLNDSGGVMLFRCSTRGRSTGSDIVLSVLISRPGPCYAAELQHLRPNHQHQWSRLR